MSNVSSPMADVPLIDAIEPGESSVTDSLTSSARWRTPRDARFDTDELDKMDVSELSVALELQRSQIQVFQQESAIYESYMRRLKEKDPEAFVSPLQGNQLSGLDRVSRQQRKKHTKHGGGAGGSGDRAPLRLTMEQKVDIAEKEVDFRKRQLGKSRERYESLVEMEMAKYEDAVIRADEIRKMEFDFQRDVITGGVNPYTGQVMAEKVARYFDDKLRKRDTLIAKLQLNLNSMRQQKRKIDLQLQQKEDVGESMKAVDFEKLRIQNRDYQEQINQSVQQILKLKLVAATSVQRLQTARVELSQVMKDTEHLRNLIAQRDDLLSRIGSDLEKTMRECEEAKFENLKAKKLMDDFSAPPVCEISHCKACDAFFCGWHALCFTVAVCCRLVDTYYTRHRQEYSSERCPSRLLLVTDSKPYALTSLLVLAPMTHSCVAAMDAPLYEKEYMLQICHYKRMNTGPTILVEGTCHGFPFCPTSRSILVSG